MDNNSIAKNSLYNVCYKLLNVLFPLIMSVYSSRILLPDGIGKVTLAQNIVTYFVTLAALGIPNYGTKRIGSIQHDVTARDKMFSELFLINFISTIICTVIYYAVIITIPYFIGNELYIIFSSILILNIINVDWFYQGVEEYKYIAIRSICVKSLCIVLLPIFVKNRRISINTQ